MNKKLEKLMKKARLSVSIFSAKRKRLFKRILQFKLTGLKNQVLMLLLILLQYRERVLKRRIFADESRVFRQIARSDVAISDIKENKEKGVMRKRVMERGTASILKQASWVLVSWFLIIPFPSFHISRLLKNWILFSSLSKSVEFFCFCVRY